ncbi:MAG: Gfo/Idh/MocA family oxidoreductase [Fimbriimonadaceae bacterium]|nr:Gfo/Idh/MocA family oxidoreductase [Fimbriimonadaceae bacterium]
MSSSFTRFGVIGAGFWAYPQTRAWLASGRAKPVAVYDVDPDRAERFADEFGVAIAPSAEALIESVDFVDVISSVESHPAMVSHAVQARKPVICQKPIATSLAEAEAMVQGALRAGVPFLIHENWRYQAPIARIRELIAAGELGDVFRVRAEFNCSFPVYDNQPALARAERFILADVGVHVFDAIRAIVGDIASLRAETRRVNPNILGEDVASVLMRAESGAVASVELSYASRLPHEQFPGTAWQIEGTRGGLTATADGRLSIATAEGVRTETVDGPMYAWVDPRYAVVQSSLVPCIHALHAALDGSAGDAHPSAQDNLKTLALVFAAYDSADWGEVVRP